MKTVAVACVALLLLGVAMARTAPPATTPRPQCDAEVSAQCPAEDGESPVYLADPSDCSAFCECSNGVAYSKACVPGLVFDTVKHVCDWPTNVDCGDRPMPSA